MYGKYDGVYLSALTHQMETPWQKVYCRGCNSEINDDDILEHYGSKLKNCLKVSIDLNTLPDQIEVPDFESFEVAKK